MIISKKLINALHKIAIRASLNDMAIEIARVWACDQIAREAEETQYANDFERSQMDVMETVPSALEDVGLKLDDYLDIDAAKKLIEAIDKEWGGKLTVESLMAEFGDDILASIALQAAGHGVGLFDDRDVEHFVKEKGAKDFSARSHEAGAEKAFKAVDDYTAAKAKAD